jgi:hypothetical protein
MLAFAIFVTISMRLLLAWDNLLMYYLIFIGFFFMVESFR